ncbi:MAG: hypothetical protein QOJ90_1919 [Actinomycetota bacterium]|nr:hypothetical protein [Actinomycetota bacterium]
MRRRIQLRAAAAVALVGLLFGALGAAGSSASADQSARDWAGHTHGGLVPPEPGHVDPAPRGVDVKHKLRTDELLARARDRTARKLAQTTGKTGAALLEAAAAAPPAAVSSVTPTGYSALAGLTTHVDRSCLGTGTDGNRVQVMYVVEADDPDRFGSVLPTLRDEVANIDDTFALSAALTSGGIRVRWVFDPLTCDPVVVKAVVPSGSLATFDSTVSAVQAAGYTDVHRKYLMFADAAVLCGIGHLFDDDSKTGNWNDGSAAMYSRVDTGCWQATDSGSTAAHELMHNLGGVQQSAVNSTPYGHCDDDNDLMCYADGSGVPMRAVCPASHEPLFDCQNDDYFSTSPAPSSYLATHWNTADSSFLDNTYAIGPAPTVTVTGPTQVRPGLPAVLTASGSDAGTFGWTVDKGGCTVGSTTGASFTLQCPSYQSGVAHVTATLSAPNGRSGQATHAVTLGGPSAALSLSLTPAATTRYAGQPLTVTTAVRYGSQPVRGSVTVWSSTNGSTWTTIVNRADVGADGRLGTTVRPLTSTYYQVGVATSVAGGWVAPRNAIVHVAVSRWAVSLSSTAKAGRPDLLTARLAVTLTGAALTGRTLTLQRRYAGSSTWSTVATRTTSSTGRASATVQPKRGTYYRWVYAGSSTDLPRTGSSLYVSY